MPKVTVEKYRYNTLADMIIQNWPPEEIARAMQLPLEVVTRFANERGPKGFNDVLKRRRTEILEVVAGHTFKFVQMAPEAYKRIEETLQSKDERLASDNAWKILREITPAPEDKKGSGPEEARNVQIDALILQTASGIRETLGEIKRLTKKGGVSYEKHLKFGNEALPQAVQNALAEGEREEDPIVDVEPIEVEEGTPEPDTGDS